MDEEVVAKPTEESQPQLPDSSQMNKVVVAVAANDENSDRLKVSEASTDAARRSSAETNSSHPAPSLTEKDTIDKSAKLSTDTTDSKTESVHVAAEKPEEKGSF